MGTFCRVIMANCNKDDQLTSVSFVKEVSSSDCLLCQPPPYDESNKEELPNGHEEVHVVVNSGKFIVYLFLNSSVLSLYMDIKQYM